MNFGVVISVRRGIQSVKSRWWRWGHWFKGGVLAGDYGIILYQAHMFGM